MSHLFRVCCLAILMLGLNNQLLLAQDDNNPLHLNSLKSYEKALKPLSDSLFRGSSDEVREKAVKKFTLVLKEAIAQQGGYDYPFDSLRHLSKIFAPDNDFRIYSWLMPSADGNTFKYYGIVQLSSKPGFFGKLFGKKAQLKAFDLKDKANELEDPENMKLKADKWYGALYYKILKDKYLGKTYYTLIGVRPNSSAVNKKVIDNIAILNDKITFGQGMFKNDKLTKSRVIFQYSNKVSVSVRYEFDKNIVHYDKDKGIKAKPETMGPMIVFDHLSPSDPAYEGQYEFYGPDGSFDGYLFKKGKWQQYQAIDVSMSEPKNKKKVKFKPHSEGLGQKLR